MLSSFAPEFVVAGDERLRLQVVDPGLSLLFLVSLSETHARTYWWCSPPKMGTANV
jgi:hypothetical protein